MRTPTALWFKWISEALKKPLTAFHMCQRLYHLLVFYHIHFFLSMSLYKIQILGFKSNYNTSWQAFNERFVFELLMESAVFSFNHICCRLLICFLPASYVICIPPDAFYIFSWLCRKWWFLWYPSNLISLDSFRLWHLFVNRIHILIFVTDNNSHVSFLISFSLNACFPIKS